MTLAMNASLAPCASRCLHSTRFFASPFNNSAGNGSTEVPFDEQDTSGSGNGQPTRPKGPTEVLDESEVVGTEPDDLMTSFRGASQTPFSKKSADILLAPINEEDVEALPGSSVPRTP